MGALMFGTQDEIECLTTTWFAGPKEGEQLCLAGKVSLHFFGAGVYVDHEHVLKIKDAGSYYHLEPDLVASLQQAGTLPTPLPPVHVAWYQYAFGYSLWIVIAGVALAGLLQRVLGKLQPFLAADVAPVTGPPIVRTDEDRWLSSELARALEPGERLQHQAFGFDGEAGHGASARYAGLTDRRLIFVAARHGLTGPKLENHGITSHRLQDIVAVGREGLIMVFDLSDDTRETFWVADSQRKFTNQWLFARDVHKLILGAPPMDISVTA